MIDPRIAALRVIGPLEAEAERDKLLADVRSELGRVRASLERFESKMDMVERLILKSQGKA